MRERRAASVIVPSSLPSLDKGFCYLLPDRLQDSVGVGYRVKVPFGKNNRIIDGYIVGFPQEACGNDLKEVKSVESGFPCFGQRELRLAEWMRDEYLCTLWDALKCMISPALEAGGKTVRAAFLTLDREDVIDAIENSRIKSIQQLRILELLAENGCVPVPYILSVSGASREALNSLKKKGYIDFKNLSVIRDPYKNRDVPRTLPLQATHEQKTIIDGITGFIEKSSFAEALIYGITGSGKTEVYMQTIEYCIRKGKGAIVLVPEISLTPQTAERFKGRFGGDVAVLHSRLSPGERHDQWMLIKDKKVRVVVGARSAVFAPVDNLGLIIIDEEHENTYKSEMTPKYHARDVARQRCMNENAVLVLGSATPSVETYHKAQKGEMHLFRMCERANNAQLPHVEIVDMREELNEGNRTIFSRKLREEIKGNIMKGEQTILFLNRRGHSTFIICRGCGYVVKCPGCNISLTYHLNNSRLICHYCGFTEKNPERCPKCGSKHIRYFGSGTQKAEEAIKKEFENVSVARMDMDATTRKNSHESILKEFKEKRVDILIGTQMVTKGHDFPNVTLVGVLAADSLLNIGDFRSSERTFQLITQVAGRAGRGELPGKVIIQTYNTEDFSIKAACDQDYTAFYDNEIKLREKLGFPPFVDLVSILLSGESDKNTLNVSQQIKEELDKRLKMNGCEYKILGPGRPALFRLKNRYRWRIVIKTGNLNILRNVIRNAKDDFLKIAKKLGVTVNIDINPINML